MPLGPLVLLINSRNIRRFQNLFGVADVYLWIFIDTPKCFTTKRLTLADLKGIDFFQISMLFLLTKNVEGCILCNVTAVETSLPWKQCTFTLRKFSVKRKLSTESFLWVLLNLDHVVHGRVYVSSYRNKFSQSVQSLLVVLVDNKLVTTLKRQTTIKTPFGF